jgi:hypothetical protein
MDYDVDGDGRRGYVDGEAARRWGLGHLKALQRAAVLSTNRVPGSTQPRGAAVASKQRARTSNQKGRVLGKRRSPGPAWIRTPPVTALP